MPNLLKIVLVVALLLTSWSIDGLAQFKPKFDKNRGKLKKHPFPSTDDYKPYGWLFGGG